jgi:hypothetical protein
VFKGAFDVDHPGFLGGCWFWRGSRGVAAAERYPVEVDSAARRRSAGALFGFGEADAQGQTVHGGAHLVGGREGRRDPDVAIRRVVTVWERRTGRGQRDTGCQRWTMMFPASLWAG